MDCIFCKIIKKEIPSFTLYEDDLVIAFLDLNQSSAGHTLIIPKEHIQDITESDESLIGHMFEVAKNINERLMQKIGYEGASYCINYGSAQEVKHLHLHICPDKSKKGLSCEEIMEIWKND